MMFSDLTLYLPDDLLTKVDRASMAHSLEARVPFLDHHLIEFAWQIPIHLKQKANTSKWLLRQVVYRHLPPALLEQPKMGFSIPLETWLRGSLRDWAEDLLSEEKLKQSQFLNVNTVRRYWQEHQTQRQNWQGWLWPVLMFQQWYTDQY